MENLQVLGERVVHQMNKYDVQDVKFCATELTNEKVLNTLNELLRDENILAIENAPVINN